MQYLTRSSWRVVSPIQAVLLLPYRPTLNSEHSRLGATLYTRVAQEYTVDGVVLRKVACVMCRKARAKVRQKLVIF